MPLARGDELEAPDFAMLAFDELGLLFAGATHLEDLRVGRVTVRAGEPEVQVVAYDFGSGQHALHADPGPYFGSCHDSPSVVGFPYNLNTTRYRSRCQPLPRYFLLSFIGLAGGTSSRGTKVLVLFFGSYNTLPNGVYQSATGSGSDFVVLIIGGPV